MAISLSQTNSRTYLQGEQGTLLAGKPQTRAELFMSLGISRSKQACRKGEFSVSLRQVLQLQEGGRMKTIWKNTSGAAYPFCTHKR